MSSIKLRIKRQGEHTLIRLMVTHPMETGRRREGAAGVLVPAHFIQSLQIEHRGHLIADCLFSTAVSRDPYLAVRLRGGASGDTIKVSWEDNRGQRDSEEVVIP